MSNTPHFGLPDFYLPWPARVNPHVDGARVHSKAWAREVGILDTPPEDNTPEILTETKLDAMDIGLFCAYSHPDALPPELELITDWIVWAFYFDDYFLEVFKRVGDGPGLRAYLDRLVLFMNVDPGVAAIDPQNPMERGLSDLWRRTIPGHSVEWIRRFRQSTIEMLDVVEWELRNIKAGRVANPIEFVQWRRPAGGAMWTAFFVEHANLAEVPARVAHERPMRVLKDTFADGVHYRNDLFSYEREVNEEGELSNFVIVLQHFFKLDAQAAANMTNDLLSSRLYQFEHTAVTEVPAMFEEQLLTPPERAAVLLYVKGLQDWQAGCHEWHLRSSRYTKPSPRKQSTLMLPVPTGLGTTAVRPFVVSPESTGLTRLRAYTHVPEQVGPVTMPPFYMPFSSRLNPHHEAARRTAITWAHAMGMLDPVPGPPGSGLWSEEVLEAFDFAQMGARIFPDAPGPALELLIQGFTLGFYLDDFFVRNYQSTRDPVGARAYCARLEQFMPLDCGVTPPPLNAAERGLASYWPRVAVQMSAEGRREARDRQIGVLRSFLWEVEAHTQDRVPDPIDFFEMRRISIGFESLMAPSGMGMPQLPPKLFTLQSMIELRNTAADYVGLQNDIVSFQAEDQYEGGLTNSITITSNFLGVPRQQAVLVVNDLITRRMQQFEQIAATELPLMADRLELDDAARETLARYVEALLNWIVGSHDWHLVSGRYAPDQLRQRYTPHTRVETPTSSTIAALPARLGMEAMTLASRLFDGAARPARSSPDSGEADGDAGTADRDANAAGLRPLAPLPRLPERASADRAQDTSSTILDMDARSAANSAFPNASAGDIKRPELPGRDLIRHLSSSVRRRARRPTVAVFGGGIAGLTAAHELIERGFDVDVYERRHWGGKARSTQVAGSATGGRRPLPGEHGYRITFGFYQNLPETMRRIPFGANPNGVFDNLVETPQAALLREGKSDMVVPVGPSDPLVHTPRQLMDMLSALLVDKQVSPEAAAHFARRMIVFCSSCDARRSDQWESITWNDFIGTKHFSDDYYKLFGGASFLIQAAKPEKASAKITGWFLELLAQNMCGVGANGPAARMLNQPTTIAWIDPWVARLEQLGARLHLGHALTRLEIEDGRIVGAEVETREGRKSIAADWYVCAIPFDYARKLWTSEILAADPSLASMNSLHSSPAIGIQFYLRERLHIVAGAAICADSPWKMAFVHQAQFWTGDFADTFGDGRAHECLSAIISFWNSAGIVYGKPASECTREEMAREAWEQIKAHVNKRDRAPKLSDEMVLGWTIDDGLVSCNGRLISEDPLPLAIIKTERYRPRGATGIPNLVLAGDYLAGPWEIGTMEAANYYGRLAANTVLERAGSSTTPVTAVGPYRPPEWQMLKQIDAQRYASGETNLFDTDGPLPPEVMHLLEKVEIGR